MRKGLKERDSGGWKPTFRVTDLAKCPDECSYLTNFSYTIYYIEQKNLPVAASQPTELQE